MQKKLEEPPKGLAKWEEQKLQFFQNQSVQVQLNPFLHHRRSRLNIINTTNINCKERTVKTKQKKGSRREGASQINIRHES